MFDHIRVADRTLLFLNTLLQMDIAWLALAWIATGTLLGALLPVLGMAVVAAFVPFYWLPIRGEIVRRDPGTS
jgi:hypothetical protein